MKENELDGRNVFISHYCTRDSFSASGWSKGSGHFGDAKETFHSKAQTLQNNILYAIMMFTLGIYSLI